MKLAKFLPPGDSNSNSCPPEKEQGTLPKS
jgi:hypothetical protein